MIDKSYIYANEAQQYSFYMMPKELYSERYRDMSIEAKVLYTILSDRVSLSIQNGWYDEEKRIYIYMSRSEVGYILNKANQKVSLIFKELRNYNLIEEKKLGLGKSNRIYVKKIIDVSENCLEKYTQNEDSMEHLQQYENTHMCENHMPKTLANTHMCENHISIKMKNTRQGICNSHFSTGSETLATTGLEGGKISPNKTYINKTELKTSSATTAFDGTSTGEVVNEVKEKKTCISKKDLEKTNEIINSYNETCTTLRQARDITKTRVKKINDLIEHIKLNKSCSEQEAIEKIKEIFKKASKSNFLSSKNKNNWEADFDWIIEVDNYVKIKEGRYDNIIKIDRNEKKNSSAINKDFKQRQYSSEFFNSLYKEL